MVRTLCTYFQHWIFSMVKYGPKPLPLEKTGFWRHSLIKFNLKSGLRRKRFLPRTFAISLIPTSTPLTQEPNDIQTFLWIAISDPEYAFLHAPLRSTLTPCQRLNLFPGYMNNLILAELQSTYLVSSQWKKARKKFETLSKRAWINCWTRFFLSLGISYCFPKSVALERENT